MALRSPKLAPLPPAAFPCCVRAARIRRVDWRKRRLRGALARLTQLTWAEYDELVPKDGRPSLQAFKDVAAALLPTYPDESKESDKSPVNGAPSRKPPILGERILERASRVLNLALSGCMCRSALLAGYEVADAAGAWVGDGGVPFLGRLAPEALTPIDRSVLGGRLEVARSRTLGRVPLRSWRSSRPLASGRPPRSGSSRGARQRRARRGYARVLRGLRPRGGAGRGKAGSSADGRRAFPIPFV